MNSPVVLITGALTGIGRATAFAFAKDNARLVISGRREEEGKALEAELRDLGAEAEFIRTDVRHEDEVSSLIDQTVARFGRLDIAVNNAGTEGPSGPVTEQTPESYAATFDTNVLGTLLSLKHELRVMQAQGSGSIVNISSTMGERGAPNVSLYTASKHAVEGLTKSASLEAAAFNVRVNAIAPGPVETDMLNRLTGAANRKATFLSNIPLKRAGLPEEIADAIIFISSERASFIIGQIIRVNGGKLRQNPNGISFIKHGNQIITTLSGKTALLTGASRGIGGATAFAGQRGGTQILMHYSRGAAEAKAVVEKTRGTEGRVDRDRPVSA